MLLIRIDAVITSCFTSYPNRGLEELVAEVKFGGCSARGWSKGSCMHCRTIAETAAAKVRAREATESAEWFEWFPRRSEENKQR